MREDDVVFANTKGAVLAKSKDLALVLATLDFVTKYPFTISKGNSIGPAIADWLNDRRSEYQRRGVR